MKEWMARLGVTLPVVALVWLFVLPTLWPPSGWWLAVAGLVVVWGVSAFFLWLEYFEELADVREVLKQKKRLDRPAARPEMQRPEETPRPEVVQQERVWPPPPDQQSF